MNVADFADHAKLSWDDGAEGWGADGETGDGGDAENVNSIQAGSKSKWARMQTSKHKMGEQMEIHQEAVRDHSILGSIRRCPQAIVPLKKSKNLTCIAGGGKEKMADAILFEYWSSSSVSIKWLKKFLYIG